MESTLTEYLDSQADLIREAALALPHQFSQCTYRLGAIRQAVYLCLTCPEPRGICSACSIACHTDHEQVELFPKRNFRCDCPTTAITQDCRLHTELEEENTSNMYGQNFRGIFCRCGRPYDAKTERETMIQCLICEDWFHESCCNLRERPTSRIPSPVANPSETAEHDDAASVASSSGLPSPLLSGDDYESFVCAACVFKNKILQQLAGTSGAISVVRDHIDEPWRLEQGECNHEASVVDIQGSANNPSIPIKRPLSPAGPTPSSKRTRTSDDPSGSQKLPCLAPPINPTMSRIYEKGLSIALDSSCSLGTGDIFLTEGFRDRWCRCQSCLSVLNQQPCLLEEEQVYEPPNDPDSVLSLEELGMRALGRIPRDKAIDGIQAFQELRNNLVSFLRPFAQEGKIVNETDIQEFFATLGENSRRTSS